MGEQFSFPSITRNMSLTDRIVERSFQVLRESSNFEIWMLPTSSSPAHRGSNQPVVISPPDAIVELLVPLKSEEAR